MILVTATPHSGKEDAFRSLLGFLDPSFLDLPDDLSGPANEHHRRRLAQHLVQRRRADIRHWMRAETPVPRQGGGRGALHALPRVPQALREGPPLRPRKGPG